MTLSHLHLVLNHVPVIGSVVAVGLLLLALVRRSPDLRRTALEVVVIVGLFSLLTYLTGIGGQKDIVNTEGVSKVMIRAHHDAALIGSISMLFTVMVAWAGLWQTRRRNRPARGVFGAVLVLAFVTVALMGRAANLGGQIRHSEVHALDVAQVTDSAGWMTAWIAKEGTRGMWAWPMAEALHFIGLWLLFGILVAVNLRLLGMMKSVGFPVLHRLLPWGMLGLTINVVTGMVFVIGLPGQYAGWTFYWKMVLLVVAAAQLLYLTIADAPWSVAPGKDAPLGVRTIASAGIFAWIAVMYLGRMLPFLGKSF
jgi:uncharacterized membrane protein